MGWLRRQLGIGRKSFVEALSPEELYEFLTNGGQARSGVPVTSATAIQVTAVLACLRALCNGIAQVPIRLIHESSDGRTREPAKQDPRFMLMARRPNAWQTSYEFREFMMFNAVLNGAAYAYKTRGVDGVVKELLPFMAQRVNVVQKDNYDLVYKLHLLGGRELTVPAADMLVLRGPSTDAVQALNPVRVVREALGLAIATERHAALLHGNGGRPGGLLSTDKELNKDAVTNIKESWKASFSEDNAYKTAILHSGFKWAPLAMTGVDAQSIETRRFQIEEIARAFGVFPAMLGHSDKTSSYASAEQFFLAHVVHSLGPWARRFEEVLERDLLTDEEWQQGLRWRFYLQALLRGDMKGRAGFLQIMVTLGIMTRNEARALEDLNPLDGLDEPILISNLAGDDGSKPAPKPKPGGDDDDDEPA